MDSNTWKRRYDLAAKNQQTMFKRFSDWYDILYTVFDSTKVAAWRSKVVFPTLGNKTWALAAKFIGLKPGFVVNAQIPPRDPGVPEEEWKQLVDELEQREQKAQFKLEHDYNNPDFDEPIRDKLLSTMIDAIVTGTGMAKVPWTVTTRSRHEYVKDEYGQVDLSQEKVTTTVKGYNDLIPVNIFNVFVQPSAANLYKSPWVIIKEYKTLAELEAINEANGGKYYQGLDKLKNIKASADEFAQFKASRNRLLNEKDPYSTDKTVDQICVYECYDLATNTICLYAEGMSDPKKDEPWVELRSSRNPYWHGKYPLVPFYVRKRPHDFWGLGMFETNQRIYSGKNDLFNHYLDQWNISVDGGIIAEENSIVNEYVIEPGFELTYKGAKPEQFKFPEPNPNQLVTVNTMLDRELEDGTISPYAAGAPNSATDKTAGTKGGIMALQEAAGDIIGFMRSNFQQSIRTVGQMWLSNNQQYMDEPLTKRMQVKGATEAVTIFPEDLQFEGHLEIDDASMQPLSKDELRQAFQEFEQGMLALQGASLNQAKLVGTKPLVLDFAALAEERAEHFGQKNYDEFIVSDEEMQQVQQQQAVQQKQAQAEEMAMQQEQAVMKDQQSADQEVERMVADLGARGVIDPAVLNG